MTAPSSRHSPVSSAPSVYEALRYFGKEQALLKRPVTHAPFTVEGPTGTGVIERLLCSFTHFLCACIQSTASSKALSVESRCWGDLDVSCWGATSHTCNLKGTVRTAKVFGTWPGNANIEMNASASPQAARFLRYSKRAVKRR